MKKIPCFLLLGIYGFMARTGNAAALDPSARSFMLDIGLGAAVPDGSGQSVMIPGETRFVNGTWGTGFAFDMKGLAPANRWLSLGMRLGLSRHTLSTTDPSMVDPDLGTTTQIDRKILAVTPMMEIGSWLGSAPHLWKPYVTAGGGLFEVMDEATTYVGTGCETDPNAYCGTDAEGNPVPCPPTCDNVVSSASRQDGRLGFTVGGGFSFLAGSHFALGPEITYTQLSGGDSFHYTTSLFQFKFLF